MSTAQPTILHVYVDVVGILYVFAALTADKCAYPSFRSFPISQTDAFPPAAYRQTVTHTRASC